MIKNLFLLLVVCAAVLFGGKYYIENRYEKEIDKAVRTYGVPVSYKNVELDRPIGLLLLRAVICSKRVSSPKTFQ